MVGGGPGGGRLARASLNGYGKPLAAMVINGIITIYLQYIEELTCLLLNPNRFFP